MKNTIELKTIRDQAWFKQWFDSVFYHHLYSNRSENEARDFLDALLAVLTPAANAFMLELGCVQACF